MRVARRGQRNVERHRLLVLAANAFSLAKNVVFELDVGVSATFCASSVLHTDTTRCDAITHYHKTTLPIPWYILKNATHPAPNSVSARGFGSISAAPSFGKARRRRRLRDSFRRRALTGRRTAFSSHSHPARLRSARKSGEKGTARRQLRTAAAAEAWPRRFSPRRAGVVRFWRRPATPTRASAPARAPTRGAASSTRSSSGETRARRGRS